MVAHQRPGINSRIRLVGNLTQEYDKIFPIQVIVDDFAPFDSADDDMMQRTRCVQSCAAWHLSSPPKQDRQIEHDMPILFGTFIAKSVEQ